MLRTALITLGAIAAVTCSSIVFGEQKDCDPESLHCVYSSGPVKGVFAKVSFQHDGVVAKNIIEPWNSSSTIELYSEFASQNIGDSTLEISICSDPQATQCAASQVDKITVTANNGVYQVAPKYFQVVLPSQ
jgi:hypothetical protein